MGQERDRDAGQWEIGCGGLSPLLERASPDDPDVAELLGPTVAVQRHIHPLSEHRRREGEEPGDDTELPGRHQLTVPHRPPYLDAVCMDSASTAGPPR